jgi:hydroxypyruvate isomerase
MLAYTVNASILLTDLPLLERPGAVRQAGFDAVEFWWPFVEPVPAAAQVDAFVEAIEDSGVQLTGLNFFAGDMAAGDRGLLSSKSRHQRFLDNIDVVVDIGERLGCRAFNALYGLRGEEDSAEEAGALAVENLARAARAVQTVGGTVLVEPVSGADAYPLKTAADALAVIDEVHAAGSENVALLADLYHLSVNGDDVDALISERAATFGHIQVADAPGRGAPGTGDLPITAWLTRAEDGGYAGWVGLEYTSDEPDPFAWLPRDQRSATPLGRGATDR